MTAEQHGMVHRSEFEGAVVRMVNDVLAAHAEFLQRLGLTAQAGGVRRSEQRGADYWSELAVCISDENGMCDALEFFIYQNGEPAGTVEEFRHWFVSTLSDVLCRGP